MSVGKYFAMLSSAALLTAMLASPAGAHDSPSNGRSYFGQGPDLIRSPGPRYYGYPKAPYSRRIMAISPQGGRRFR
jgi:hypothetical protein